MFNLLQLSNILTIKLHYMRKKQLAYKMFNYKKNFFQAVIVSLIIYSRR